MLTPDQSAKFDKVFEAHAEVGAISGQKVRELLMKSELPKEELSTVWGLCKSERNQSPNLGKFEFRVAMHLVTLRLQGVPLPHSLPACLQPHRDAADPAVQPRNGSEGSLQPPMPGRAAGCAAATGTSPATSLHCGM